MHSSEREYPRYALVGVGAVVIDDGRILLVKRGSPPGRGLWAVPGGVVEAGEGIGDAAIRELREETGLVGRPLGVVNVDEAIVRDEEGEVRYHYVIIDVLMEIVGGEPAPGGDAVEVRWFNMREVQEMGDVTPGTKRLVLRLLRLGGEVPVIPLPGGR